VEERLPTVAGDTRGESGVTLEPDTEYRITDVETPEALYGKAAENSLRKECDHIHRNTLY
jgi:hypothetical protein